MTYYVKSSDGREWGDYSTRKEAGEKLRQLRADKKRSGFRGTFRIVKKRLNPAPKNWVKADAVRVRRVNGKTVVEIRRKKTRKRNSSPAYSSPLYKKASLKDRLALRLRTARKKLTGKYKRNTSKRKATRQRKTKKKGRR